MTSPQPRWTGLLVVILLATSCSPGEDTGGGGTDGATTADADGSGGHHGTATGGSLGTGGSGGSGTGGGALGSGGSGAGGTLGTGGRTEGTGGTGTAGNIGTGGRAGRGGNIGTGGGTGTAGNIGTGGRTGTGGNIGTGGGAGAGGNTGTGGRGGAGTGGGTFSPCPVTGECKVLPLGDSITEGIGSSSGGAYRLELFSRAVMASKKMTYVGPKMAGPGMVAGMPFPKRHDGWSGFRIDEISKGTNPYSTGVPMMPDIVLLHIGTNDIGQNKAGAPARLSKLVDDLTTDLPNAVIVVAKIIPLPARDAQVKAFNDAIGPIIESKIVAGKHVLLVDQYTGFPSSQLGDGVHPTDAGYARMAGVWYAAIGTLLR